MSRWFPLYYRAVLACAAVAGVAAIAAADDPFAGVREHPYAYGLLAVLLLAGEVRPVRYLRYAALGAVVPSTAFSFAVLLAYGLPATLAAQVVASVAGDIASRRPASKAAFNAAQYVLALGAAAAVLAAADHPVLDGHVSAADLLPVAAAAVTYFTANNLLVGIVIALHTGRPPAETVAGEMRREAPMEALLLGLGPLGALLAFNSPLLLPLLFLPAIAVYRSSQTAQEMERRVLIDALTSLPNLDGFLAAVAADLDSPPVTGVVAVVDLAAFKRVNGTLGHATGDKLLVELAGRLETLAGVTVAGRVGGDQFALWAPERDRSETSAAIRSALAEPIEVGGFALAVEVAIGVSCYPLDATAPQELLRRADTALHRAKLTPGRSAAYMGLQDEQSPRSLRLLGEMRGAIGRGELVLHYQPQVEVTSGEVVGLEALVRWQHPELGLLAPSDFVDLADQSSLIEPLTRFVLRTAVAEARRQLDRGHVLRMSVNVSPRTLERVGFPVEVAEVLAAHDLPASLLGVEITESALLSDFHNARKVLDALARMAIGVAVDDFGTGYSSIRYLRELPVSEVKIDRGFIAGIADDDADAAIVQTVVDLAARLHLTVVAEGVETQAVWNRLAELRCQRVQGYFVSRPLPAPKLDAWLAERRAVTST